MACFVAPMTVAIIATTVGKSSFTRKYHFDWLLLMIWGGTTMLIIDHIATGEIVPYSPFLTKSFNQILPEILKVGIPMAVAIILLWLTMVWISIGLKHRNKIRRLNLSANN